MPIQVGIDLVSSDAVKAAISRHGERYLKRVYRNSELSDADRDPLRLAGRFAAKEAAMKALRRDDEPLPWRDIAVRRDRAGRPELELRGAAARLAERRGVQWLALSMSHEGDLATAVVLAEVAA